MTEKIEVRYSVVGGGAPTPTSVYHKYVVYTDHNGVEHYARGGPSGESSDDYVFGVIETEYGEFQPGTVDWDGDEPQPDFREIIQISDDLSSEWEIIKDRLDAIEDEGYIYNLANQNSNSVVNDALQTAGLPAAQNPNNLPSPGSNVPLEWKNPFGPPNSLIPPNQELSDFKPAGERFGQAPGTESPLVLDLDGDGIETTAMGYGAGASSVYFDMDNDGFAERTGWVTGGDGLLAIDQNNNGKIDNQSELFGNNATYADGFAALTALDSNVDNKITSADTNWSKLRVWVDANGDAVTDSGELKTLASLGITQISLNDTPHTNTYNSENLVTSSSTFVKSGVTRTISDVWFRNDSMDTRYLADVTLHEEVFYLPTLKGVGELKALHVAMSQDSALRGIVKDFVLNWTPAQFLNPSTLDSDVQEILFKWAGVDGVSPTSRGAYVDGRVLGFMEALTGQPYNGVPGSNPIDVGPGGTVTESYQMAFDALKAQLIAQSGGYSLFAQAPVYNVVTGDLIGGEFTASSIAVLQSQASSAADKAAYWQAVGEFLLNVKPINEFTPAEITALDNAISATSSSLTWQSVAESVLSQYFALTLSGTDISDHYVGAERNDYLMGAGGSDILEGHGDNDLLQAGDGNDVLDGGGGNDTLEGDAGNDAYFFGTGFGQDTVSDSAGTDKIQFGAGITLANLRFWVNGNSLQIYVGSDSVALLEHFYDQNNGTSSYDEVEQIAFADTTTLNLLGSLTYTGTSDAEYVYGTVGNDTLVGLGGDDNLEAGSGNDTYFFNTGFGQDTVSDSAGTDKIQFGAGVALANVRFWVNGNSLQIFVGSDSVTLFQHFYDLDNGTSSYDEVEQIAFADTSTLNLLGSLTYTGTSDAEYVYGTAGNDTLVGLGGDDNLEAGTGNDTYFFNTGFGQDIVSDSAGADKIQFGAGITLANVRFWVTGNSLQIFVGSDSVTLFQHFYDLDNGTSSYDEVEQTIFADTTMVNLLGSLTYTGTSGAEYVYGTVGNDTLVGLGGDDNLEAGTGNDTYFFNTGFGQDIVSDSAGTDIIRLGAGLNTENISVANYSTWGTKIIATAGSHEITIANQRDTSVTESIETLQFSDGFKANLLTYSSWVWGTSSAQTTTGTANADTIFGRGGNDTINGNNGNDAIHGGSGTDTITGGNGNDQLHGGVGNDNLNGNADADILFGGDGLDTLTGSTGADRFVFTSDSAFNNIDVITDFSTSQLDKIDLSDLLQQYDPVTEAITDFIQFTTSGSNSLLKIDVDGGGNSFVQIATLNGVTGLTDEAALVSSGHLVVN